MPTPFQAKVYKALEKIPEGSVTSYGAVAKYLGTNAVRAVGTAVGKNPYAPKVPCHRVVRSDGKVGDYSAKGGVAEKVRLLAQEGVEVKEGRIVAFESHLYRFEDAEFDA